VPTGEPKQDAPGAPGGPASATASIEGDAAPPAVVAKKKGERPQRGHHDGSLYHDEKRDLWRGVVMLDGKRYWLSGKTEAAVKRKIADKRKDFYDWSLTDPNRITVAQLVTDWLENVVKKRRRQTTYSQYENPIRVYFLPRFGTKLVRDLKPRQLEAFYGELEEGTVTPHYKLKADGTPWAGGARRAIGLAPKSIRNLHTGLHAAFERAVRHRIIPRNPADGLELPAIQRRKKMAFGVDDVLRLLRHSQDENDPNYPLWVFLAHTGLRIGEALALRWANVDLDTGWFLVEEGLDLDRTVGEVKTDAGYRDIPLTSTALEALNAHKATQDAHKAAYVEGYEDHGLVFATSTGKPGSERNALRSLSRLTKRAKVDIHITPHDFRRMCASLLVASGVDITTAAAIMGHKNASVLLDVYAQALKGPKRAAADKLQAHLGHTRALPVPVPVKVA